MAGDVLCGLIVMILSFICGMMINPKPKIIGSLIINDLDDSIEAQCVLLELDSELVYLKPGESVSFRIVKQI